MPVHATAQKIRMMTPEMPLLLTTDSSSEK